MGGVAGHLMHLYDDRGMTFNKVKSILSAASNGELEGTEKTDGFNIYLGIKQDTVLYTQGQYDFVEIVEAPGPSTVLGFTIWYAKKGFGSIQTLPAFGDREIRKIIKKG